MVVSILTHFTYAAILFLLVGAGVGLPFPEELTQLTAGFLARRGTIEFWPALATTYAGIVLGDYLLFRLGRRHGPRMLSSPRVAVFLTPRRRRWIESHYARHAFLTIMVARHASGLRLPTFALAGASGVRSRTFLLADGLSAMASVPIVVTLGYVFAENLERVKRDLHGVELAVLAVILVSIGVIALWRRRRRRIALGDAGAAAEAAAATPAPRRPGAQPRHPAP